MGRGASAAVALIIGTVEISDLRVSLIEVEMQVVSAIGTDQQAGKHILLALVGSALADFAPFLLNLLPHGAINNRLMDIFENHPIFTVVFDSLLIFVRLGVGLKIEDIAAILLQGKNFCDGRAVPLGRRLLLAFSGTLDTLFQPVARGVRISSRSSWAAICSVPMPSRVIP